MIFDVYSLSCLISGAITLKKIELPGLSIPVYKPGFELMFRLKKLSDKFVKSGNLAQVNRP